jgi:hypothetical protein
MDALKKQHIELVAITRALDYDINSLLSGTKSAATSSRSKLLALSKLCGRMRKTVMTAKSEIPSRSRIKKTVSTIVVEQKQQQPTSPQIDGFAPLPSDDDDESVGDDALTQQFEKQLALAKVKRSKKARRSKRAMRLGM